jgi:hypothetical protein
MSCINIMNTVQRRHVQAGRRHNFHRNRNKIRKKAETTALNSLKDSEDEITHRVIV